MGNQQTRLLSIDLLKIIGIALVVVQHAWSPETNFLYFSLDLGVWYFDYGSIGVTLFLVASGLSLAYSHPNLSSLSDLKNFYKNRLLRIYPAYWIFGLGFTILLFPSLLGQSFENGDLLRVVTGFQSWGATSAEQFYGKINGTLWFVQLIICLYMLFPVLLYMIKKHPKASILSLFAISMVSRYYFTYHTGYFLPNNWVPLCRLFEFGLGIFLVTVNRVPNIKSPFIIKYFSNISFYIFLINSTLLNFFPYQVATFLIVLFVLSTIMHLIDKILYKSILVYWRWQKNNPWFMD